jgi:hypothetical protein
MGIIETLQAEIQALKERVTALEQRAKGSDAPAPAPRQLTRGDIIEMAKRDVAELVADIPMHYPYNYVDFVVNRDKRTVVALLRIFKRGEVHARGIAKCHPDDCFNATIGRAIALRRALGLEVPDEYLNAPQPTEVRVGDVVRINCLDASYVRKIASITSSLYNYTNGGFDSKRIVDNYGKIIDDTRDEV